MVHPSALVTATPAKPRRYWRLAAIPAGIAAVGLALVLISPGGPTPAQADVITGNVLTTTQVAGSGEGDWAASAVIELTDQDGAKSWVRAWSKQADLGVKEGETLTYRPSADGQWIETEAGSEPLGTLPADVVFVDGGVQVTVNSDSGAESAGAFAMSGEAGDSGDSNAVVILDIQGPAGDVPYQTAVVYAPTDVDGVEVSTSLIRTSDNAVFYAQVRGDDPAQARKVLENLTLTADGAWQDPAAATGLASATQAEQQLVDGVEELAQAKRAAEDADAAGGGSCKVTVAQGEALPESLPADCDVTVVPLEER
jgi:hypothetical protein